MGYIRKAAEAFVLSYESYEHGSMCPWGYALIKDEKSGDEAPKMLTELITCNNPDQILESLRAKGLHK